MRGHRTAEILEKQLAPALRMAPDLVTLFTGTNDVIAARFDSRTVGRDVARMQRAFRDAGTTVLGFTLPDLATVVPLGRLLTRRIALLNEALRQASAETGSILIEFGEYPVAVDLRIWNEDRIHVNAIGHARIASALGDALGLDAVNPGWADPLPADEPPSRWEAAGKGFKWLTGHLLPWVGRRLLGRSSSDGVLAKRPTLQPVFPTNEPQKVSQTRSDEPPAGLNE